jgi:hypothetical protein
MWDSQQKQYVWVAVPITEDELKAQAHQPVRLSHEPRYWLYRDRFVEQEDVETEPDDYLDLLQAVVADDETAVDADLAEEMCLSNLT